MFQVAERRARDNVHVLDGANATVRRNVMEDTPADSPKLLPSETLQAKVATASAALSEVAACKTAPGFVTSSPTPAQEVHAHLTSTAETESSQLGNPTKRNCKSLNEESDSDI